ncbi:MAG: chromate transporter [Sarcina sp.]
MKLVTSDYGKMFISFFKIGAFTFGGGYAMIPLIEKVVVEEREWIDKEEFMEALIIAQSLPGALAVNTSIFVGYKISKIKGALVALLGTILPSISIILIIAMFLMNFRDNLYVNNALKGINSVVPILILIAVTSLSKNFSKTKKNLLVCITVLALLIFLNMSPILAILIGILYGVFFCENKGGSKKC